MYDELEVCFQIEKEGLGACSQVIIENNWNMPYRKKC